MDNLDEEITSKLPPVLWRKIFSYFKNKKDLYSLKLVNKNLNFFSNEIVMKIYIDKIKEEREIEDKYITKRINDHCEEKEGFMLSQKVFEKLFGISEKSKELEKELNNIVQKTSQQHEMRSIIINNDSLDRTTKIKMLSLCSPHSEFMNMHAIQKDIRNMAKEVVELFNNNNKRDQLKEEDPFRVHDPLRIQRPKPNPYDPFNPYPNYPDPHNPFYGEPEPDHENPRFGFNQDYERDRNPLFMPPFGGRGQNPNSFNPFDPNSKNWGPRYL